MTDNDNIRLSNAARLLLDVAILVDRAIVIMVIRTFALNEFYKERTPASVAFGVAVSLIVYVIVYMSPVCRKAHTRFGTLMLIKIILLASAFGCLLCAMHLHFVSDVIGLALISVMRPTEPVLMHAISTASSETEFINYGRTQTVFRLMGTAVGVVLGGAAYWSQHWSSVQICFAIFSAWYAAILVAVFAASQNPSCCESPMVENRLHLSIRPIGAGNASPLVTKLLNQLKYEAFCLSMFELMLICNVFFYASPEGEYPAAVGLFLAQIFASIFLLVQRVNVDWMFSTYYLVKIAVVLLGLIVMPISTIFFHDTNVSDRVKESLIIVINIIPYVILVQIKDYSMPFWVKVTNETITDGAGIDPQHAAISVHYSQMFSAQMVSEVVVTLLYLFLMPLGVMTELMCTIGIPFASLFMVILVKERRQAIVNDDSAIRVVRPDSAHAIHNKESAKLWVAPPFDVSHFPSGINPQLYTAVASDATATSQDTLILSPTASATTAAAAAEPPNADQLKALSHLVDTKQDSEPPSGAAVAVSAVAVEMTVPRFTIDDLADPSAVSGSTS